MIKDDSTMQWFLEGELKDHSPWIIPVHDNFFIGRLATSDIILTSALVSRRHARMNIERGDLFITDLKSSNGTYVNGQEQNEKFMLRTGDLLKIGISEFKVCSREVIQSERKDNTFIGVPEAEPAFEDHYNLSGREAEILFFLIKGFNLQEIGEKLFISTGTVKNHVLKIYKKTDCHSRIELATRHSQFEAG